MKVAIIPNERVIYPVFDQSKPTHYDMSVSDVEKKYKDLLEEAQAALFRVSNAFDMIDKSNTPQSLKTYLRSVLPERINDALAKIKKVEQQDFY